MIGDGGGELSFGFLAGGGSMLSSSDLLLGIGIGEGDRLGVVSPVIATDTGGGEEGVSGEDKSSSLLLFPLLGFELLESNE